MVVSADQARRNEVFGLLDGGVVRPMSAASGQEALTILRREPADCLVFDANLPDMNLDAFVRELSRHAAAARDIAERVFHFKVVLPSLLEQALPRHLQAVA